MHATLTPDSLTLVSTLSLLIGGRGQAFGAPWLDNPPVGAKERDRLRLATARVTFKTSHG